MVAWLARKPRNQRLGGAPIDALILQVTREGLYLLLLLAGPPVLAGLLAGALGGAVQSATRIQEPALAQVPRWLAVVGALLVTGPWIGEQLLVFAQAMLGLLPALARS